MEIRNRSAHQQAMLHKTNEPEVLERWLSLACAGDEQYRDKLFAWVHRCALEYYSTKSGLEPLLTMQDAQDLASECVLEFSKRWRRVRSVSHYCRRMYKNNLLRYLKRRRRLINRECALLPEEMDKVGREAITLQPVFDFEQFCDEDRRRIRFAVAELERADTIVQELFRCRVLVGAWTYSEIADQIGATETSLRMRMARFNRKVRRRYDRESKPTFKAAA